MQTLTLAEFAIRLSVGLGCGALIGLERQWRARTAGLRTNALVAAGATLFVLYSVAANDTDSPTRVAAYVVSGVGFLGGGVILREGFNVSGLNTAATLWCSAAVGVLAADGHLLFAIVATGIVVATHLLGRPLGHLIDRDRAEENLDPQPYRVQAVCRPESEQVVRAHLLRHTAGDDVVLHGIRSGLDDDGDAVLTAQLLVAGRAPDRLERLVAELSQQPGVNAVHWYADDQAGATPFGLPDRD